MYRHSTKDQKNSELPEHNSKKKEHSNSKIERSVTTQNKASEQLVLSESHGSSSENSHLSAIVSPRLLARREINNLRQKSSKPSSKSNNTTPPRRMYTTSPRERKVRKERGERQTNRSRSSSELYSRRRRNSFSSPKKSSNKSPRNSPRKAIRIRLDFESNSNEERVVSPKKSPVTSQSDALCPLISPRGRLAKIDETTESSTTPNRQRSDSYMRPFRKYQEEILPSFKKTYDVSNLKQKLGNLEKHYKKFHGENCISSEPFIVASKDKKTLIALESFTFTPRDAKDMVILCLCGNSVLMQDNIDNAIKDAITLNCTVILINYRNVGKPFLIKKISSESPAHEVCNGLYRKTLSPNERRELATSSTPPTLNEIRSDIYNVAITIITERKLNPTSRLILKGRSLGGAIGATVAAQLHSKGYPVFFFSDRSFEDIAKLIKSTKPKFFMQFGLWLLDSGSCPIDDFLRIDKKYRAFVVAIHDKTIRLDKSIYAGLKSKDKNNEELEKSILFTPAPLDAIVPLINYVKYLQKNKGILKPETMATLLKYVERESSLTDQLKKIFRFQSLYHLLEELKKNKNNTVSLALNVSNIPHIELKTLYTSLKELLQPGDMEELDKFEYEILSNHTLLYTLENLDEDNIKERIMTAFSPIDIATLLLSQLKKTDNTTSDTASNLVKNLTACLKETIPSIQPPLDAIVILLSHIEYLSNSTTQGEVILANETKNRLSHYLIKESEKSLVKLLKRLYDFYSSYKPFDDLENIIKTYDHPLIKNLSNIPFKKLEVLYFSLRRQLPHQYEHELCDYQQEKIVNPHNVPLYTLQGLDGDASGEEKFYNFFYKACLHVESLKQPITADHSVNSSKKPLR